MRNWWHGAAALALAAGLVTGCGSDSGKGGGVSVAITGEVLETVAGGLCAVKGNATNIGNLTANVSLTYEAKSPTGVVLGTATATFQVAGLSNFEFRNGKSNHLGQPSSVPFSNGLACAGIANFSRTQTDVQAD